MIVRTMDQTSSTADFTEPPVSQLSPPESDCKPVWNHPIENPKFHSRHHKRKAWPTHDLWTTELLVWLMPTHMLTHVARFITGLSVLFAVLLSFLLFREMDAAASDQQLQGLNAAQFWVWLAFLSSLIPLWIYWYYHTHLFSYGKCWMDPSITSINRLPMHVPLRLFESKEEARRAACLADMVSRDTKETEGRTPNVLLLDKQRWTFQLMSTVEEALHLVQEDCFSGCRASSLSTSSNSSSELDSWSPIPVPGNWMLQGFDDIPIYTNKQYPFPNCPPVVPLQNPTGVYRLETSLPVEWQNVQDDQVTLLLHGVESACFVYWDGQRLGFFKDSRLPSEFKIPHELLDEREQHTVHLVVARWSDGTYVEDQDHWMLGGVHRSVELVRWKRCADIVDYHVSASCAGDLAISVYLGENHCSSGKIVATVYDDDQITADGDWRKGQQRWSMSHDISGTNDSVLSLIGKLDKAKQWTAETPVLYTLILEQYDESEKITQVESCRVGFRTIDITEGVLQVNGEKITVCGVNRHEHDPDHGKVVSLERMKQDVVTLKQHNFNAVRTSHYPAHSSFYRLCDFYGLYVCDEANIETDGMKPMGRLSNDFGWEKCFVSRVHRMVQRDYNHPSILMWSLGNESGRGRNLAKAREKALILDTTRPIVYESGGSWTEGTGRTELTDVVCPMYPDVSSTIQVAENRREDRPIILCEYSHSMNNSNGNLHLYWAAFWDESLPTLQGGFIWDMIDQGLRRNTPQGKKSDFNYGGDYDEPISDYQFCINGMFSPDREPHPAAIEIQYLQQPIHFQAVSQIMHPIDDFRDTKTAIRISLHDGKTAPIAIQLQNRYSFLTLDHVSFHWTISCDRSTEPFHCGKRCHDNAGILLVDIQPAVQEVVDSERRNLSKVHIKYFLKIVAKLRSDQSWATSSHVVAREQFQLYFAFGEATSRKPDISSVNNTTEEVLSVTSLPKTISVALGNTAPFVTINCATGCISQLKWNEIEILCSNSEVAPNFTRAATDNDKGGMELVLDFLHLKWATSVIAAYSKNLFSYEMQWKDHDLSQTSPPLPDANYVKIISATGDCVTIAATTLMKGHQGRVMLEQMTTYEVKRDRTIKMCVKVTPKSTLLSIPSLARMGITMSLNQKLSKVLYFGCGPIENYPDRKASSELGLWETAPSKMGHDYIVPAETGNRCDCDFVAFDSGNGGMIISTDTAMPPFSFSALLHSAKELHQARHTYELADREDGEFPIHVNVDHRLMGLGGDLSWAPCVYPQYQVLPKTTTYSLWLLPFDKNDTIAEVARQRTP